MVVTHMRDKYADHAMLRVEIEGQRMFCASADPEVVVEIIGRC